MKITDIEIILHDSDPALDTRCLAFAKVTFDTDFVVEDFRLIRSGSRLFVASPDRPICRKCPKCSLKIPVRSRYCHDCGFLLSEAFWETTSRNGSHTAPVAYPINHDARYLLERQVWTAYDREIAIRETRTRGTAS